MMDINGATGKKRLGILKNKNVDFIQKDQNNHLWLFDTGETIKKSIVQSVYILDLENKRIDSFEEKLGAVSPFKPSDIQTFFEDGSTSIIFLCE